MFGFIKNIIEKLVMALRERRLPEAKFVLEVTETEIVNHHPEGKIERVAFADLKAVIIETNDSGPWGTDVWWILFGNGPESGCVYPGGATGEQVALIALQRLPGFDNQQVSQAMSSVINAKFICWQAITNATFNPNPTVSL